jgi:hypothetical protein
MAFKQLCTLQRKGSDFILHRTTAIFLRRSSAHGVRKAIASNEGHYTVYLPAYDDKKLVKWFLTFSEYNSWHLFSKHVSKPYHIGKISVFPVDNEAFTLSLASSQGVYCVVLVSKPRPKRYYLKKKLLVVPMKNQYEQHFNAASLKQLGVPVLKKTDEKAFSEN